MPDLEPIQIPKWNDPDNPLTALVADQAVAVKQLVERVNYLSGWITEHENRFKEHAHEYMGNQRTSSPVPDK